MPSFSSGSLFSSVAEALQIALKSGSEFDALSTRWAELQAQSDRLARDGRRYADYFDFAPEPYLATDREGMITAANNAASELLGLPRFSRKPIAAFVALEQRSAFRRRFGLLRSGRGDASPRWASVVRRRDGERIAVNVHVRAIEGEAGTPRGYCWLIRRIA